MTTLETYLRELRDIRSTGAGVEETSCYTPLANLLNEIGKSLKPRVRCVINLQNRGAGLPDGGFFTPDQFQRGKSEPRAGKAWHPTLVWNHAIIVHCPQSPSVCT
jgi:hypothetical protein